MVMMYVHALVRRDVFFFLFDTHRRLPLHLRDARQEKETEESEKDEAIRLALVRHQDGFLLSGQLQGDD